jgi:vancomycin resistance protein VanW
MIKLIKLLRGFFPDGIKLWFRLLRRKASDAVSRRDKCIAPREKDPRAAQMGRVTGIRQPIKVHEYSAGKIHNIKIAVSRIEGCVIGPGQIFSFWHLVGRSDKQSGFLEGRALSDGRLGSDIGGGLCQLAGIIYHLALLCGMHIIERFPHSVDLYTDEERYTPLGTDAAVLYGYKDLRFLNTTGVPVSLKFTVSDNELTAEMTAPHALEPCRIDITVSRTAGRIEATTIRMKPGAREAEFIAVSRYMIDENLHG